MNGLKICFENKLIRFGLEKAVLAVLCFVLFLSLHSNVSAFEIIDGHLVRIEAGADKESEEKDGEEAKEDDSDKKDDTGEKDDDKSKDQAVSDSTEDAKDTEEAAFDENGVREVVFDNVTLYAKMSNNNLREKPVTDAEILDLVPRGIELEVMSVWETEEGNIWYKLKYGDNIGYVWGDAVKIRSEVIETEEKDDSKDAAEKDSTSSGEAKDRIDYLPYTTTFDPAYEKYLTEKEKAGNVQTGGEDSSIDEKDQLETSGPAASKNITPPTFSESFQRSMGPFLITLLAVSGASFVLFLVFFINFLVQSHKLRKRAGR